MRIDRDARSAKLQRIALGGRPRTLELCSGSGGMSLGLSMAGFQLDAHVEMDATAAATYALNFPVPADLIAQEWIKARDMVSTGPEQLVHDLGIQLPVEKAFDVVAAGLPCQAFARIGRSKLRSVRGEEDAFRNDPRAALYLRFLHYVERTQPLAVLVENVPDILNFGGRNVPEEIGTLLDDLGYITRYALLNAAFYGVPQMRERLFLIAIDKRSGIEPFFPEPTRSCVLPQGYRGSRRVALKHVPAQGSRYVNVNQPEEGLPGAIGVSEALSDLPVITEHLSNPREMRRRKLADQRPYRSAASPGSYAALMREWSGRSLTETNGHLVRITPRDFETFAGMAEGDDYPRALSVALERLEERLSKMSPRPLRGSTLYAECYAQVVPPYDASKFPNKWWKLNRDLPSRTLTAHMGKDTYSHIHWDSSQMRTVSVREAARLQSFPDHFTFSGQMNAAFRQIGNAVPPLLAEAVARSLMEALSLAARTTTTQERHLAMETQLEAS